MCQYIPGINTVGHVLKFISKFRKKNVVKVDLVDFTVSVNFQIILHVGMPLNKRHFPLFAITKILLFCRDHQGVIH